MKAYVAVTDKDWYEFLSRRPDLDEVNFWQPGGGREFRVLQPGQPFLFKLHYPENAIVGGGFFTHFSRLPVSLAWEAFGEKNGARSYEAMRARIERYRRIAPGVEDYEVGCIILEEPFFFPEGQWLPAPASFRRETVQGKGYDLSTGEGRELWEAVLGRRGLARRQVAESVVTPVLGEGWLARRRLGQGAFRVLVTDAYQRHCAVTGERTLPVLEAAHIRPVARGGLHRVDNGLLLRSDVHTLFDLGYVTVTPAHTFRVSRKLRETWHNGRVYYELEGKRVEVPAAAHLRPSREALEWQGDVVFRG